MLADGREVGGRRGGEEEEENEDRKRQKGSKNVLGLAIKQSKRSLNLSHQDVVDAEGLHATALAHLRLERRKHPFRKLVAERLGATIAW